MPSEEQIAEEVRATRRDNLLVYCTFAVRGLIREVEANVGSTEIAMDLAVALQKLETLRRSTAARLVPGTALELAEQAKEQA